MRIGILAYDLSAMRGGVKLALTTGTLLQKLGHEVAFSCVHQDLKYLERKFGCNYRFRLYEAKHTFLKNRMVSLSALWNHFWPTYKLCKNFKPDIVIEIGGDTLASLFPAILLGIPTAHYCIFPVSAFADKSRRGVAAIQKLQLGFFRLVELFFVKRTSAIIAMCDFVNGFIKKAWKINVAAVIRPPIDPAVFLPLKKRNIILSVCRYDRTFRLEKLIEIFEHLCFRDYELHFVAEVTDKCMEYYNEIKNLAKNNPRIFLHANLDNDALVELYGQSKIFWYSNWGQYGLIAAEAQSAGTPVVIFGKNSGIAETVADGKTGFVLDTGDFQGLEDRTRLLLENEALWKEMSESARKRAVSNLSVEKYAEEFDKIIKQIVRGHRQAHR